MNAAYQKGFVKAASAVLGTAAVLSLLSPKLAAESFNPVDVIRRFEGFEPKAYTLKGESIPTVGYGTQLNDGLRAKFQQLFGTNVNFDAVRAGKAVVSQPQATQLLQDGITTRSNALVKAMPAFANFPERVKASLLSGYYRGDFGPKASPATWKLISQNNWAEAAKQYRNNNEYRNAITLGKPGIRPRMDWNADQMNWMARNVTNNPVLPPGYKPVK